MTALLNYSNWKLKVWIHCHWNESFKPFLYITRPLQLSCQNLHHNVQHFQLSYEPETHTWRFRTAAIDGPDTTGSLTLQCWITTHCQPKELWLGVSLISQDWSPASPFHHHCQIGWPHLTRDKKFLMGIRFVFLFTPLVATTRKPLEQHLTGWKNYKTTPVNWTQKWIKLSVEGHVKLTSALQLIFWHDLFGWVLMLLQAILCLRHTWQTAESFLNCEGSASSGITLDHNKFHEDTWHRRGGVSWFACAA